MLFGKISLKFHHVYAYLSFFKIFYYGQIMATTYAYIFKILDCMFF